MAPRKIDAATLECCLDFLADKMVGNRKKYECLLPIYNRIESELQKMQNNEQRFADIYRRSLRSKTAGAQGRAA